MKKILSLFLSLLMVAFLFTAVVATDEPPVINISKIDNALAFESDALIMTPAFGDSIRKTVKTVTLEDDSEFVIGTDNHEFKWWAVAVCEWDTEEGAYVITAFKPVDGVAADYEIPDNGFVLAVHITDLTNDSTAFAEANTAGKNALAVGEKVYLYNIDIANAEISTSGTFASRYEDAGIQKGIENGTAALDKDGEAYAGELVFDSFETDSFITVGAPSTDTSLTAYDPTAVTEESEDESADESTTPGTGDATVPFVALIVASAVGALVTIKKRKQF